MTLMRFLGGKVIDKFGRVAVLRASMAAAAVGLVLFVLADNVVLAGAGATLWGVGAALAFPMGMSAAADDRKHAAARVSVVSTIGYVAFLAGPPAGLPGRPHRYPQCAPGHWSTYSGCPSAGWRREALACHTGEVAADRFSWMHIFMKGTHSSSVTPTPTHAPPRTSLSQWAER